MFDKIKEPLFHIVKRDALPWYQSVGIRAIAIVLALIVCAVVTMILTGTNPIQVFQSIIAGAFGSARKTWITFQNLEHRWGRTGTDWRSCLRSMHDLPG